MKVVYIAHPINGDIKGNLKRIKNIGRQINLNEPSVVPFAHYFFDCAALDDNVPEERERGIKNNITLMRKGFIDEVRLYGDKISAGMAGEVNLALELGIDIKPMTKATIKEYQERWQNVVTTNPNKGKDVCVGIIAEIMIKLKCEKCGVDYEKPTDFKKWNDERPNVFFRWSLAFCDTCRRNKEKEALKKLPEVIKALANES